MITSTGKGNNLKILEYNKNLGEETPQEAVYGVYYYYNFDCGIRYDKNLEMSDQELRSLAVKSGTYDFWDVPEEDIYSLSDGEPV